MEKFIADILSEFKGYYDAIVPLMPKLLFALIVLFVFRIIAKRAKKSLLLSLQKNGNDKLTTAFIGKLINAIILLLSLLIFLRIIGMGGLATGIWGTAGVGAFIIGFAFKDIGEHFLAGFILAFNRPFRVGDLVELGGEKGKVISLNIRTTHLKTFDGQDVYVPNGNIIKNSLINYTIDGFIRKEFTISLDYRENVDNVIQTILSSLENVDGILNEKKQPSVAIQDIGRSTLSLTIYYWLDTFNDEINATQVHIDAITSVN